MKLSYVLIYVDDVSEATKLYKNAFDLKTRFKHPSNMYAELDTGGTALAFAKKQMLKQNTGVEAEEGEKNSFSVAFVSSDVQAAFNKAVEAGMRELVKPKRKIWGQTVGYLRDPFGTIVEISSPK